MTAETKSDLLKTAIAFLAVLVTVGQLWVAFSIARDSELRTLHDIEKDNLDANAQVARLLLEHPDMFTQAKQRVLGTEMAKALPETGLKRTILLEIQSRSTPSEAAQRAKMPEVAAALNESLKVTIHYEGKGTEDQAKAEELAGTLDENGWNATSEYAPKHVKQHILCSADQNPGDAEALRRIVLEVFGKKDDPDWMPIQLDKHTKSYFGIWIKPLKP